MRSHDAELLCRYAEEGDQAAFAAVTKRYVDLVYSVARRVLGADEHLAADVTQAVFIHLARQAADVARHPAIAGWLHKTTRLTALDHVRREQRRRARETAFAMQNDSAGRKVDWAEIRPILDEAVGTLRERDRDAIVLSFFEQRSYGELAETLGITESAARKRVERALTQMRTFFGRRGVALSSGALSDVLAANFVQAAPADLPALVAAAVPAAGVTGMTTLAGVSSLFTMSLFVKSAIAVVLVAVPAYLYLSRAGDPAPLRSADVRPAAVPPAGAVVASPVPPKQASPVASTDAGPAAPTSRVVGGMPSAVTRAPDDTDSADAAALAAAKRVLAHIGRIQDAARFDDATVDAVHAWMARDPREAILWLGTIPLEGNQREHTTEALIAIETSADPEAAFLLANSMANERARVNRLLDVLKSWGPHDPTAAIKAVETANIPEADRPRLIAAARGERR